MPGDTDSSGQLLDNLDRQLDTFETQAGLPPTLVEYPDLATFLRPDRTFLRGLSAVDCGEIAILLQQVSFHLQRTANRERVRSEQAKERLARVLVPATSDLPYKSAEEKWRLGLAANPKLRGMESQRLAALARLGRVEWLSSRVESLARFYNELQHTKRMQHD